MKPWLLGIEYTGVTLFVHVSFNWQKKRNIIPYISYDTYHGMIYIWYVLFQVHITYHVSLAALHVSTYQYIVVAVTCGWWWWWWWLLCSVCFSGCLFFLINSSKQQSSSCCTNTQLPLPSPPQPHCCCWGCSWRWWWWLVVVVVVVVVVVQHERALLLNAEKKQRRVQQWTEVLTQPAFLMWGRVLTPVQRLQGLIILWTLACFS